MLVAGGREAPPPPPCKTQVSPSLSSDQPIRGKPSAAPTRTPSAPPPPPPRNGLASSPRLFLGESSAHSSNHCAGTLLRSSLLLVDHVLIFELSFYWSFIDSLIFLPQTILNPDILFIHWMIFLLRMSSNTSPEFIPAGSTEVTHKTHSQYCFFFSKLSSHILTFSLYGFSSHFIFFSDQRSSTSTTRRKVKWENTHTHVWVYSGAGLILTW